MSERSFDNFDEFAADYRNIHTQNVKLSGADSFYFAEMKVLLLKEFETDQSLKILDIGCGDGATEVFMQQYFPSWQVMAIDISQRSIEAADKRKLSNTSFTVYDGKHVPFEDDSFDLVFMAGVLHHVAFHLHDGLINEISRVLKKDGRLYLYEHNPLNPLTKYLVKTCVFDKDAKLLQHGYASRLLNGNLLAVKNKNFIIFFPRKGILSKLIFLEKYLQWLPFGGQYFIRAGKR
jgi:ubiquinone/menaquinone biosynthesis C-methylase UbiE